MVTVIHIVASVISAILRLVAVAALAGGSILLTAAVVVVSLSALVGASSFSAFHLVRRKRGK